MLLISFAVSAEETDPPIRDSEEAAFQFLRGLFESPPPFKDVAQALKNYHERLQTDWDYGDRIKSDLEWAHGDSPGRNSEFNKKFRPSRKVDIPHQVVVDHIRRALQTFLKNASTNPEWILFSEDVRRIERLIAQLESKSHRNDPKPRPDMLVDAYTRLHFPAHTNPVKDYRDEYRLMRRRYDVDEETGKKIVEIAKQPWQIKRDTLLGYLRSLQRKQIDEILIRQRGSEKLWLKDGSKLDPALAPLARTNGAHKLVLDLGTKFESLVTFDQEGNPYAAFLESVAPRRPSRKEIESPEVFLGLIRSRVHLEEQLYDAIVVGETMRDEAEFQRWLKLVQTTAVDDVLDGWPAIDLPRPDPRYVYPRGNMLDFFEDAVAAVGGMDYLKARDRIAEAEGKPSLSTVFRPLERSWVAFESEVVPKRNSSGLLLKDPQPGVHKRTENPDSALSYSTRESLNSFDVPLDTDFDGAVVYKVPAEQPWITSLSTIKGFLPVEYKEKRILKVPSPYGAPLLRLELREESSGRKLKEGEDYRIVRNPKYKTYLVQLMRNDLDALHLTADFDYSERIPNSPPTEISKSKRRELLAHLRRSGFNLLANRIQASKQLTTQALMKNFTATSTYVYEPPENTFDVHQFFQCQCSTFSEMLREFFSITNEDPHRTFERRRTFQLKPGVSVVKIDQLHANVHEYRNGALARIWDGTPPNRGPHFEPPAEISFNALAKNAAQEIKTTFEVFVKVLERTPRKRIDRTEPSQLAGILAFSAEEAIAEGGTSRRARLIEIQRLAQEGLINLRNTIASRELRRKFEKNFPIFRDPHSVFVLATDSMLSTIAHRLAFAAHVEDKPIDVKSHPPCEAQVREMAEALVPF